MTEQNKEKLREQIQRLPDYEVVWLWQLVQGELERRDANWPRGRGWRALSSEGMRGGAKLEGT